MSKIFLVDVHTVNGFLRRQVVSAISARLTKDNRSPIGLPDIPIVGNVVYLPAHSGLSAATGMQIIECIDVPPSMQPMKVAMDLTFVDQADGVTLSTSRWNFEFGSLDVSLLQLNAFIIMLGGYRYTEEEQSKCLDLRNYCRQLLNDHHARAASVSNLIVTL